MIKVLNTKNNVVFKSNTGFLIKASKGLSIEYIAEINEIDVEYVRKIVKNITEKEV